MKTQATAYLQLAKNRQAAATYQAKPTKKLILNMEVIRVAREGTNLKREFTTRPTMGTRSR